MEYSVLIVLILAFSLVILYRVSLRRSGCRADATNITSRVEPVASSAYFSCRQCHHRIDRPKADYCPHCGIRVTPSLQDQTDFDLLEKGRVEKEAHAIEEGQEDTDEVDGVATVDSLPLSGNLDLTAYTPEEIEQLLRVMKDGDCDAVAGKIVMVSVAVSAWRYRCLHEGARWGTLEEGMSVSEATALVGQPTAIREDDGCSIYSYRFGAGLLTFVNGRLRGWTCSKPDGMPPAAFLVDSMLASEKADDDDDEEDSGET